MERARASVVPGGIVGLYGLTRLPRRSWLYLALGAVPALAITLGFDYLSFHNATVTGYNARGGSGPWNVPRASRTRS